MSGTVEQLDTRIRIITPENIAFEYRLAGPFRRLPAYLIDLAIRCISFLVIGSTALFAFGAAGLFGFGLLIAFLAWFLLAWFYGGLFETFWNGQTPGKRLVQLRVISTDGRPINGLQAVLRNVLRMVDALPVLGLAELFYPTYMVGLIAVASGRYYQRLGDLACGTIVVVEERTSITGVERVSGEEIDAVDALLPAGWVPSRSLVRALSHYVSRRRYFGKLRRAEIAGHVGAVMVERLQLPPEIDHDALLCALYRRAFVDQPASAQQPPADRSRPVLDTMGR